MEWLIALIIIALIVGILLTVISVEDIQKWFREITTPIAVWKEITPTQFEVTTPQADLKIKSTCPPLEVDGKPTKYAEIRELYRTGNMERRAYILNKYPEFSQCLVESCGAPEDVPEYWR